MIALAGLGACLAGCVSDLGAASNASDQQAMRYYGGPKYSMAGACRELARTNSRSETEYPDDAPGRPADRHPSLHESDSRR
jgi:hypothetical protein